jgi:hypothetical protein
MVKIKVKGLNENKLKERELRINHMAIYKLKKNTGKDIISYVKGFESGEIEITAIYEMLFAGLSGYKTIDDMLNDLEDGEFSNYAEGVTKELGLLFEGKM